ncbi:hypothetical protein BDR26DRAFT_851576 [Obelidium mucronatum]|nr:hypothetical protein BDR26DRAFT_851576 [Obelidium mucronatum]
MPQSHHTNSPISPRNSTFEQRASLDLKTAWNTALANRSNNDPKTLLAQLRSFLSHRKSYNSFQPTVATGIPALNSDVLYLILCHIHPKDVLKYRRVCKDFNECLSSTYFALLNLSHFPSGGHRLWFVWPQTYQQVYLRNLESLEEVHWKFTKFKASAHIPKSIAIPPEIGDLVGLETLILQRNDFIGSLPSNMFTKLPQQNNWTLLPASIGSLVSLEKLNLSYNEFVGPFPSELQGLTRLQWLNASNNEFSGSLTESVSLLTSIQVLNLSNNFFTSSIPNGIGCLMILREAPIPESIGNISSLECMDLSRNKLTGSIPSSFGNLVNLGSLALQHNLLTGYSTSGLEGMVKLSDLRIAHNKIALPLSKKVKRATKFYDRILMNAVLA